jgi:hypothetical protein
LAKRTPISSPTAKILSRAVAEEYGMMRSEGNAGAIRGRLAQNEAVMAALAAANYDDAPFLR